jgi:hypothetical protein
MQAKPHQPDFFVREPFAQQFMDRGQELATSFLERRFNLIETLWRRHQMVKVKLFASHYQPLQVVNDGALAQPAPVGNLFG